MKYHRPAAFHDGQSFRFGMDGFSGLETGILKNTSTLA
jgi:hypothetical protein